MVEGSRQRELLGNTEGMICPPMPLPLRVVPYQLFSSSRKYRVKAAAHRKPFQ